jgi:hypothetical protein
LALRFTTLMLYTALFVPFVSGQTQPTSVSFEQLAKSPESYHGKLVEVTGFFVDKYENSGLYPSKTWKLGEGIWVMPNNELIKKRATLKDQYLKLIGIFNARDHGHLGQFTGALAVKRFELVPEPEGQ